MFAVLKTGGKQYRVAPDDVIRVEKIAGDAGAAIELGEVLMIGADDGAVTIGAPLVEGARVAVEIVEQTRGDKVIAFKKRRRQNSRRKRGHRQELTVLRVTDILAAAGDKPRQRAAKPKAEAPAADANPGEGAADTAAA
jgi:large subunit ribosomal protein L21